MTKAFAGKAAVAKSMAANAKSNPIFGCPYASTARARCFKAPQRPKTPKWCSQSGQSLTKWLSPRPMDKSATSQAGSAHRSIDHVVPAHMQCREQYSWRRDTFKRCMFHCFMPALSFALLGRKSDSESIHHGWAPASMLVCDQRLFAGAVCEAS